MTSKQLTVLTENSALHLSRVLSCLSSGGVDIRAHCLVDNGQGHGKLRMIVSQPEKAVQILGEHHFTAISNDVVIIEADDKPGGLSRVLEKIAADDLQIDYTYTAAGERPGRAFMVFRFTDNARAIHVLQQRGLKFPATVA